MSKIYADTIETESSNVDITLGAAGDAVLIPTGATLKTNKIADAGGNNIITSDGSGNLTLNSGFKGAEVLITTQTADDVASILFTSDIDSTYDVYIFKMININPVTDNVELSFQMNASGQTGYDETMITTQFHASRGQDGSPALLEYDNTSGDQPPASAVGQQLLHKMKNAASACGGGELYIFQPSNTVFTKQFYFRGTSLGEDSGNTTYDTFSAGYFNTTAALTEVQFKMTSGNINAGTFKMYGLLTS